MASGLLAGCDDEIYTYTTCVDNIEVSLVDGLEVMRREVSNKQYKCCVLEGGCDPIHGDELVLSWDVTLSMPVLVEYEGLINTSDEYSVESMTWNEARKFCSWIDMRLPTEDEWLRIVHHGGGGRFPWGNSYGICNENISCNGEKKPLPCSFELDINQDKICDLGSGLFEWTATPSFEVEDRQNTSHFNSKGGAYTSPDIELFYTDVTLVLVGNERWQGQGFRCVN